MEIAEFYESQYLLSQMQERYRGNRKSKEDEQKTACKIYSEREFDKNIETIDAKHVKKIVNMIDFSSIIVGYMGKKNLDLNISDFI